MQPISTARLLLRPLTLEDAPFILRLLNEPSFLENIGDRGVRDLETARGYLEAGPFTSYRTHGLGLYAVELKDTGEAIGLAGLLQRDYFEDPDLGYALFPAHWGKGYALEAAEAFVAVAREARKTPRLLATVEPGNAPSIRLLKKLGFAYEKRMRTDPKDDEVALYALAF